VSRTTRLIVALAVLAAGAFEAKRAGAQEWAQKMFNKLDHNFGTVARGADTVYRFEITNLYKQDMNITGVRSSCGCTSPSVEGGPIIKTHEKAYIAARFNTRTHVGQRGATLTVSFGPPYYAEVQLHVHGNIRSDVVFSPGAIEFGEINEGDAGQKQVSVVYAGRSNWEIVDVLNDNDNFAVELGETGRATGRVSYNLDVKLKPGLPAGTIKDQLTVVTNDSRPDNQRIPLIVSARIRPEFSVTPQLLVLGEMEPGQEATKKVVVRGVKPFKIVDVTCNEGDEDCFEFVTDQEAKLIHFVEVKFRAGEEPGKLETPIRIVTDSVVANGAENRAATFTASATVVAAKPVIENPAAEAASEETAALGGVRTASAP
jgi:hypothetical protein